MARAEQGLADLGVELPPVAAPGAVYVPAVVTGSLVFTSGQLPFVDGALSVTGKVGDGPGLVSVVDAAAAAALAAVRAEIGSLYRVIRVVKLVGFVASDPGFTNQSTVINGASQIIGDIFGDAGLHARSAVGMAALPLDSPVEIELVVEIGAAN